MLDFFEKKRLGAALRAWREAHKVTITAVVRESKSASKKPVPSSTISALENHGKGYSFKRLVEDILPAYGIRDIGDFDLFLDYCLNSSLGVAVIKDKDRDVRRFHGTREFLTNPDLLGGNRARISVIEVDPGKGTLWQNHEGHEYLMISKGTVVAEFGESREGERNKVILEQGDAVAFPSTLYHRFENQGSMKAELIVARPAKSLPRGMYDNPADHAQTEPSDDVP